MRHFRIIVAAVFVAAASVLTGESAQWELGLPKGAFAYNFGAGAIAGFTNVTPLTRCVQESRYGFVGPATLSSGGSDWPDPLSGTYVSGQPGDVCEFRAKVPNGEYLVWVCAGKIIRPGRFLLKLNGKPVIDATPSAEELEGEDYQYRFLRTQCSRRPERIWARYIDRMYASSLLNIKVDDGSLVVQFANHFISSVFLAPVRERAAFEKAVATIRESRVEAFASYCNPPPAPALERRAGDGDCMAYVPAAASGIGPTTVPGRAEREVRKLEAAGAPGERVVLRLGVVPFSDLGRCSLVLSDLTGPGMIPAAAIRGYYLNHLFDGNKFRGSVLVPGLTVELENGLTQGFWLWLTVPGEAKPGFYEGTFVFKPEHGKQVKVPVSFEVYPFRLEPVLPVSYGFWGKVGPIPKSLPAEVKRRVMRDRLELMRELGLTAITASGIRLVGLRDGKTQLALDPTLFELAKEAGMARHPNQMLLHPNVMAGFGRSLGRRLPGSGDVGGQPGIELRQPEFKGYFMDAMRQYAAFIEKLNVPFAATAVDEPRETNINSWNRNFDDTVAYCKMLRKAGLTVCVNPMSDMNGHANRDYSPFVDHVDVLSTHAWQPSAKLMRLTRARKKTLWLFNVGTDRYSWGFYNWRAGSTGRWEWHLHWPSKYQSGPGYPNREWHNPFSGYAAFTLLGPHSTCKGGIIFTPNMFEVSQGINDYAYIYTLTEALKAKYAGPQAEAARRAREFVEALRRAMPEFPRVKGMGSAADGPKVGMGIDDEARLHVSTWRKEIAGHLKAIGYKAPGDPPKVVERDLAAERAGQVVEAIIKATHAWQIGLSARSGRGAPCFGDQGLSAADLARLNQAFERLTSAGPKEVKSWVQGDDTALGGGKCVAELVATDLALDTSLPVSVVTRFIQSRVGDVAPARIRAVASLYQMVLETSRDGGALQQLFKLYVALGLPVCLDDLAIHYERKEFLKMGAEFKAACCPAPFSTSGSAWHFASRKIKNWGEQHSGRISAATYVEELLAIPAVAQSTNAIQAMPAQRICVLGHSYTMSLHWSTHASFTDITAALIRKFNPEVQFLHISKGGMAASTKYLGQVLKFKPDVTLLVVKARDAYQQGQLRELVRRLTAAGSKVYFYDDLTAGRTKESAYGPRAVEVAREAGATIIEIGRLLDSHLLRGEFVCLDGVHMRPSYHKVMAAELVRLLAGTRAPALPADVGGAAELEAETVRASEIQRVAQLPKMTGWQWAPAVKGLTEISFGKLDVGGVQRWTAVRVFMGNTPEHLYVLFVCCEPNTDKIKAKFKNPASQHDAAIWRDDTVEMFFATEPATRPRDYYQLIINSAGVVYDGYQRNDIWQSGARVRAHVVPAEFGKPGSWFAEAVIPWESLGGRPEPGAIWRINLTRSRRQLNVGDWEFTWAEMPGHKFHQPDRFRPITFK